VQHARKHLAMTDQRAGSNGETREMWMLPDIAAVACAAVAAGEERQQAAGLLRD
jgi:hypothetical protein